MTDDDFRHKQFSHAVDMLTQADDYLLVTMRKGEAFTLGSSVSLCPFMIDMADRYYEDQIRGLDDED